MAASNCYMPTWTNGRLVRKGSYCNWESVLSHAKLLLLNETITAEQFDAVRAHIIELLGGVEPASFAYSDLAHMRPGSEQSPQWSADDMHTWCCKDWRSVHVVKISATSEVELCTLQLEDNNQHLLSVLTQEFTSPLRLPLLQRRSTSNSLNSKHQQSYVLYCNSTNDNLEYNSLASSLCKNFNVYGDAYVVQIINELCFLHRERVVNFTVEQFNNVFKKKTRKRSADSASLTKDQYCNIKAEMQESLNCYEAKMSKHAQAPLLLANAALLKPASAQELLSLARANATSVHVQ